MRKFKGNRRKNPLPDDIKTTDATDNVAIPKIKNSISYSDIMGSEKNV